MKLKMPAVVSLSFATVVERGRTEILSCLEDIGNQVDRAVDRGGASWHPTGFMVLPLRDVDGLGLIRLHIWPAGVRPKRAGNPEIHSHVFHLASYVLDGTYVEHQFVTTPTSDPAADYRGYSVLPPVGDGKDRILPDGSTYLVERVATEVTAAGGFHNLPAGVYHLTDIGAEPVATVALLSRPQPGMVDHLVGIEDHEGLVSERQSVDPAALSENLSRLGIS